MLLTEGNENHLNVRVSDIADEPGGMLAPIVGYEDVELVSLELAVQPLVSILSNVESHAYAAKQRCTNPPPDGLTIDQSAAIMLYTMSWRPRSRCLYNALNATLRSENREKLEPWFLYLKLFLTALARLPSQERTVYRGVKLDLRESYANRETIVWWGFTSCTSTINVLQSELFLGQTGTRTMFTIECQSGKNIKNHSYFKSENEILIPAATHFRIVSHLHQGPDLLLIQLKEEKLPFPLLSPVSTSIPVTVERERSLSPQNSSNLNISPISSNLSTTDNDDGSDSQNRSECITYKNSALKKKIRQTHDESIDLSEQNLIDDDIPIVVKYAIRRKGCIELSLTSNKFTCTGAWILAEALLNNILLQDLSLWNNNIGDNGANCLAQSLLVNNTLQILNLGKNKIGNEGAEVLAAMLRTNKSITELYLGDNNIGNDGAQQIAKSITKFNRTLKILSLTSNTLITDQSIGHLQQMLRLNDVLKELWIDNCGFSSIGKQRLQITKRNQLTISAR